LGVEATSQISAVDKDARLRKALMAALKSGYQVDQGGFDLLSNLPEIVDLEAVVSWAVEESVKTGNQSFWLSREVLEEAVRQVVSKVAPKPVEAGVKVTRGSAIEVESRIEVLSDPTNELGSEASLENFIEYFRDRFRRTERLLRKRMDARDAVSIEDALEAPLRSSVKTIGMVAEKMERKGVIRMRLEGLQSSIAAIVTPSAERSLIEKVQRVFLDQVVCVTGLKVEGAALILTEITWPDLPDRVPAKADVEVCAALLSDMHVGSKMFLRKFFDRFIQWLKGDFGTSGYRDLSGKVKYLVIAGDLADGIGVYPEQERELNIYNIYEQYKVVADYIEQVPEHIEVIAIPGNHDAVRQALPQPAILRKYAAPLYEGRDVHMLGNPSTVRLHGVTVLIYHGRSLDDVVASVPNTSFENPDGAMELLLKARHLSPIYGQRTAIAPERRDFLLIEEPPDIFHAGHIHIFKYRNYRGTLIVNSGTWQSQTSYQRKNGLNPTPAHIPIVNLKTLQVTPLDFTQITV